ncbi:DegT/DnrJ/EryC1/StrS family aminotransferase [Streptomyces sp. NPDC002962]|uniref:DegT/DnrJ/EryC1/StrS family aminotransferase n=1 Tax=Streptomyces sp. NPDC002962 TaxID=3364674 RepID=UPI0036BD6E22
MSRLFSQRADQTTTAALLDRHQISTSVHFRPVDPLGPYQGMNHRLLPVTETAAARQLSLPCYPAMTDEHVDRVINAVRDLWLCQAGAHRTPGGSTTG